MKRFMYEILKTQTTSLFFFGKLRTEISLKKMKAYKGSEKKDQNRQTYIKTYNGCLIKGD